MIYVMDASAGIEIALDRESAGKFRAKLESATKIITSELYKAETANVIWKYFRADLINKETALRTLKYCDDLIDEYVDISTNYEEALLESMRLNHPTYDLLYMTLSRRKGGILLSMDKKLKKLSAENGVEIFE